MSDTPVSPAAPESKPASSEGPTPPPEQALAPAPKRVYGWVYRGFGVPLKGLVWMLGTPRWKGTEIVRAQRGGFIAAANHTSDFDPITTAHVLYNNGAPPRIMAKSTLFDVPFLGWLLRSAQMIPVKRGSRDARNSLRAAEDALRAGECVLIFPEGTHTKDPDVWPMVARTGVARLAFDTGCPVIPIAQWGARQVVPPHKPYFRPFPRPHFDAIVGEPVDLSDLAPAPGEHLANEVLIEATARIMAAITDQLAQIRGEEPPATPYVRERGSI